MTLEFAKAELAAKLAAATKAQERARTIFATRGHCFELETAEMDAGIADEEATSALANLRNLTENV
jgi:hypothetical protein